MKYMITFTHTAGDIPDRVPRWAELTDEEKQGIGTHLKDFMTDLEANGSRMVFVDAPENARTVHLNANGDIDVTEGALMDGDEFVGGHFIIEAESMDEAVEWAKRGRWLIGSNEVREIKDLQH